MPIPKIQSTLKKFMNEYVYISIQSLTDQEDIEIYIKAKGFAKKELNTDETGYKP